MLLFQKRFHEGLLGGQISVTFRRWPRARVKPGGKYRCHPIGVLEVDNVARQKIRELTEADARRAGFPTREALLEYLAAGPSGPLTPDTEVFRVELHHAGEADFAPGASDDALSAADRQQIEDRLRAFDDAADAPWTAQTLGLIAERPHQAGSQLARALGRETAPFKADVVKLKKLGLTQSFEVGYDLTPRGRAFLRGRKVRPRPQPRKSKER